MPLHHTPPLPLGCGLILAFALTACSPSSPPPHDANLDTASATVDEDASAELKALRSGSPAALDKAQFLVKCQQGNIPSVVGTQPDTETCNAAYAKAERSVSAARVLIGAHSEQGAAKAVSLGDLRARLPQINWTDRTTGGSTIASGQLGDFEAVINQRNHQQFLAFNWSGPAGEIPVNVADAVALAGADMTLLACSSVSADETGRAWHVRIQGADPFDLVTFDRIGPSGTALSTHSTSTALDGNRLTLDTLHSQDSDWVACG